MMTATRLDARHLLLSPESILERQNKTNTFVEAALSRGKKVSGEN
jgi:hypothetical protein